MKKKQKCIGKACVPDFLSLNMYSMNIYERNEQKKSVGEKTGKNGKPEHPKG